MKHVHHRTEILRLAHAVLCGQSLDEAEMAFVKLCTADLEAAIHLADLIVLANPGSAPLWQAIIDHMAKEHPQTTRDIDRQSGVAISADDTRDTAGSLAAHMGWLDVETGGKA